MAAVAAVAVGVVASHQDRVALAQLVAVRGGAEAHHAQRGALAGSEAGELLPARRAPAQLRGAGADRVERIDAERDYVRLHVGAADGQGRSYLLLQTIAGLEGRLDPTRFLRIHRSTILRRDRIRGLRHEGLGVWSVELDNGEALRIGRTYLRKVKAMAGR